MSKPEFVSAVVPYIDASGRNVMVAIAKSTWRITLDGLVPHDVQMPVQYVDTHVNDDPAQEMLLPSDLCDQKPAAELLVIRPRERLEQTPLNGGSLQVQIGSMAFAAWMQEPWPFGPLRRDDPTRLGYAGTYDQRWQQERMPLLPHDFDHRYHHCAPAAQVAGSYFAGDEFMSVTGLYASPVSFQLPGRALLVSGNVRQRYFTAIAVLDTVMLWAEAPLLTLVWRYVIKPRQKIAEIGRTTMSMIRLRTARELYA